jgi:hypothetical protein
MIMGKKFNNHSTLVKACKKIANVFGGHVLNPNSLSLKGGTYFKPIALSLKGGIILFLK